MPQKLGLASSESEQSLQPKVKQVNLVEQMSFLAVEAIVLWQELYANNELNMIINFFESTSTGDFIGGV